jgi:hypothetical protein
MGTESAVISVATDKKITVRLIPKLNFQVIDDSRVDVDVPEPGKPLELCFGLMPTKLGEGEAVVSFCQGPLALATLKLKAQIVKAQSFSGTEMIMAEASVTPRADIVPRNTMMVYVKENDGKISYDYHLLIDSTIDKTFESDEFKSDDIAELLEPYMDFLNKVEAKTKTDFELLQTDLRTIGAGLFYALFPKELQEVFWKNRKKIDHIKFYCDDSYIPWEILYVCNPDPSKPLPEDEELFLGQMGLVRWLPGNAAPELLKVRPGRARYIIPSDSGLAYAQSEGKILEELFGAEPVEPATRREVLNLLKNGSFDLLHFAGHGKAVEASISDAYIVLEQEGPESNTLLVDLKPDNIRSGGSLKDAIVVLNACEVGRTGTYITKTGGFAPEFLRKEVGIFVGALWDIGDESAITFIEQFYRTLLDGKTIAEAVRKARKAAYDKGDATFLAYAVYADPFAHLVKNET